MDEKGCGMLLGGGGRGRGRLMVFVRPRLFRVQAGGLMRCQSGNPSFRVEMRVLVAKQLQSKDLEGQRK